MRKIWLLISVSVFALTVGACASEPSEFPYGTLESLTKRVEFDENGSFRLFFGATLYSESDFVIDGDQITFGPEQPLEAGRGSLCEEFSTYTWEFDGEVLTFEAVGDACADLTTDLTGNFIPAP